MQAQPRGVGCAMKRLQFASAWPFAKPKHFWQNMYYLPEARVNFTQRSGPRLH
jgi:hypothetical protein